MWIWVLGILGVGAVVWLAVSLGERERPPVADDPAVGADEEASVPGSPPRLQEPVTGAAGEDVVARLEQMRAAVRRYEEGCSSRLEQPAGQGLGDLVAECMDRLSVAVDAVVASDTVGRVAIDERLEYYREQAERLEATPPGEDRARPTRNVFRSAAELLAVIRDERYAESMGDDGALRDVRQAASAIDPDRSLAAQQERTQRFFLAAGALLSAMARPEDPGPGS